MGAIVKEYTATGNRRSRIVRVLFDAGSKDSLVRRDIAEVLGDITSPPSHWSIKANNAQGALNAYHSVSLDIDVGGARLMHHFYAVDKLAEELIAGADLIRKWKISLDLDTNTVTVDPRAESLARRTGIMIPVPVSGE